MELRQLRHFVKVAQVLNLHRAALAMNMTQPPLSVSIRRLEEELGAPLFDRLPRGVALTELGEQLVPYARRVLTAVETLNQIVREAAKGERGRLRVGFVGTATYALIPAIIPAFRRRYPHIDLNLKEATSVEIVRGLEDGDLDAGLVRTPLADLGGVEITPLYREELVLMMAKDHWLRGDETVDLARLRDEPFVIYDRARVPTLWNFTHLACESAGFVPRIAEEATHIHTVVALVESGLGLALGPAVMRRAAAGRVRCANFMVQGRALELGFAVAMRREDRRAGLRAFVEVSRACADDFDMSDVSK